MRTFSTAIFDMDGLLVDTEPLWDVAKIATFAGLGLHLTGAMCTETKGFRQRDMVAYWYERRPWSGASLEDVERRIVETFIRGAETGVTAMPGVLSVVGALKDAGLSLAVASSSPLTIIRVLVRSLGIYEAFDGLFSAEDEVRGKPDPAIYLSAARGLSVPAEACLAFEDSAAGVQAAVRAGMFTIAVPHEAERDDPVFSTADMVLKSLEDFRWPLTSP